MTFGLGGEVHKSHKRATAKRKKLVLRKVKQGLSRIQRIAEEQTVRRGSRR